MATAKHARISPRARIGALLVLGLCLVAMAAVLAHYTYSQQAPIETPAADHAPSVDLPQPPVDNPDPDPDTPIEEPEPELPDNPVDFAALQAEFPDAVAWIRVPNTNIDYAIMQSGPGTDEDFYLTHNEAGEKKRYGSIYIQLRNSSDFTDPNTVIYGHNMASGSMFANVHKFKKKAFFDENQYIYVYTPGHVLTYRIYSLFTYGSQHLLTTYDFETEAGYQSFIDKTLNPKTSTKQVREGILPTTTDRVITLSTCVSGQTGSGRLLLVAVLEEDMETK